jgi:hypothetical protein
MPPVRAWWRRSPSRWALQVAGELGADIVVGEAESHPLAFGGLYLSFFAARDKDVFTPGRWSAKRSSEGRRGRPHPGDREQHIRREGDLQYLLNRGSVLTATITWRSSARRGSRGRSRICRPSTQGAQRSPLFLPFAATTFNEFVVEARCRWPCCWRVCRNRRSLPAWRWPASFRHGRRPLVCVTENSRAEIDALVRRWRVCAMKSLGTTGLILNEKLLEHLTGAARGRFPPSTPEVAAAITGPPGSRFPELSEITWCATSPASTWNYGLLSLGELYHEVHPQGQRGRGASLASPGSILCTGACSALRIDGPPVRPSPKSPASLRSPCSRPPARKGNWPEC